MQNREIISGAQIRFDPKRRQLSLLDSDGKPVPPAQRNAYIESMTLTDLRALVASLFELPIT
jgi:hypothetical protein